MRKKSKFDHVDVSFNGNIAFMMKSVFDGLPFEEVEDVEHYFLDDSLDEYYFGSILQLDSNNYQTQLRPFTVYRKFFNSFNIR